MSISFYGYVKTGLDWIFVPGTRAGLRPHLQMMESDPRYDDWLCGAYFGEKNPLYDPRLDVNLCNRNAWFVLNELGFVPDEDGMWNADPMAIDVFEAGVRAMISRNPEPIHGIESSEEGEEGCIVIVDAGIPDGYANRQFERLLTLVQAGREYGATHIGWA